MARVNLAEAHNKYHKNDDKSVAQTISTRTKDKNNEDNPFTGIHLNLQKEAIIDVWQDSSPRYRVSVQFLLETGLDVLSYLEVLLSSCGNVLEISKPVSDCITDVDKALIYPKVDSKIPNHRRDLCNLLSNHTRYVARKASIKKLNNKIGKD